MDRDTEGADTFPVWIDWNKRIVSFQEAEGFEKLEYPTHNEMFQFAMEKVKAGFAIQ